MEHGVGAIGFVDLPGYFTDQLMNLVIKEDSWDMVDLIVNIQASWRMRNYYAQAYAYNVTDEEVHGLRGVEAGNPRGAYSAPSQYGIRIGYYW